jgi:hypothetical protein
MSYDALSALLIQRWRRCLSQGLLRLHDLVNLQEKSVRNGYYRLLLTSHSPAPELVP